MQIYLIALVVGNLASKQIGPVSHVWTEPENLEAAALDFSETNEFLTTAAEICGPYIRGHYDLLVLPPSFSYGGISPEDLVVHFLGMENPTLTFVSHTLLSGDKANAESQGDNGPNGEC